MKPEQNLVDDDLRAFLAQIDTAYLATASAAGDPYVQHRGGPRGFIRALDDRRIAFLDLAGNRQYISVGNLAENPRVCLFLMDYAHRRRVKVWGTAELAPASGELLTRLALPGVRARAERVVIITVTRWDVNCPAHIPRKVDLAEVTPIIERLEARIAELEARLRAEPRAGAA